MTHIDADKRYIMRPWGLEPLVIKEARGIYVVDENGKSYIDCTSGMFVMAAGHSHPKVVDAIKSQAERTIQLGGYQSHPPAVELAQKLASIAPIDGEKRVFFCTNGSEAVEYALKMARCHTKKKEVISLRYSYHGLTHGAGAVSGMAKFKAGLGSGISGVYHAKAPYCYRCDLEYPDCSLRCAADIEEVMQMASGGDVAAVILEPVLGAGGVIIPPDGYLAKVKDICQKYGALFIADEVQCGFGRTGRVMFAIEHWGVRPDIMAMAKTVGGGLPLGAVAAGEQVANSFEASGPPTFAASPLACAAGLATIAAIEEEKLLEKASRMEVRFRALLEEIRTSSRLIGDVRIKGLMCAVELVLDRKTKEPAKAQCKSLRDRLLEEGVLCLAGGAYGNVLRLQPPLIIEDGELLSVSEKIGHCLAEIEKMA